MRRPVPAQWAAMARRADALRAGMAIALASLACSLSSAWGDAPAGFKASIRTDGLAQVTVYVPPSPEQYHVLYRGADPQQLNNPIMVALDGVALSDPYPARVTAFYRVKRVPLAAPDDSDADGADDLFESRRNRYLNPVDASDRLRPQDGTFFIPDQNSFEAFSERADAPGLMGVPQLKFLIAGIDTEYPLVYFMNSRNHPLHAPFVFDVLRWRVTLAEFNAETYFTDAKRKNLAGSIVAYPSGSGSSNLLAVEFWPADPVKFEFVRKAFAAIAEQMPWASELVYHPAGLTQEELARREALKFSAAKLTVVFSDQLFGGLQYSAIYTGTAFGVLRKALPGAAFAFRDIVLAQAPPAGLGHVAGIITTAAPAPLSHFALLARQNRTPSVYAKDAWTDPVLNGLLGKVVRLEVTPEGFQAREASPAEAQTWEDSVRPKETRTPARDLSERRVRNLDALGSSDAVRFGSKAANVAELLKILPLGMAPMGQAVPFSFYDEFMKFNGFYDAVRSLISDPAFASDSGIRAQRLAAFRAQMVRDGILPSNLAAALDEAHRAFPAGTRVRCRSSSNNEDLQGFNGAGLYDSFTHRPDEGALANTVKQVWASLWNLRAFEEREFQRIDHFGSAMGVLLHPSFPDEAANGVAVTKNLLDPNWPGVYVNAQVGEDLVTSPEPGSVPDEFVVSAIGPDGQNEVQYLRRSNRTIAGETVLSEDQIEQLASALGQIHEHFQAVYQQERNTNFAMEVEFKITAAGQLVIKQARPWVE